MSAFARIIGALAVLWLKSAGSWVIPAVGAVGLLWLPSVALGTGSSFTVSVPANTTAGTKVTDVTIYGVDADGELTPFDVDDDGDFTSTIHSTSKKTWTLDGASLDPGDSTTIKVTGADLVSIGVSAWSWKDSAGKEHKGASLPDPVGCVAVFGGAAGVTFLEQFIPPGKWGYFYQAYNSGSSPIARATFHNRSPDPPTGFMVLMEAYPTTYIDQFDPAYDEETQTLNAFDYMAEGEATSTSGIPPTSWSFDSVSGDAVAEFGMPLEVGQTSSLFGFIADAGPHDAMFDVNETVQLFSAGDTPICPNAQNGLVPTAVVAEIPTVTEWGLIVLTLLVLTVGTVIFGRRRRRPVTA